MNKVLILICFTALVFATSCKKEEKKEEEDVYEVTNPLISDTTLTREYVCQIRAIQHIELSWS